MPDLLFYESGHAPSTRSVRELIALRRHGWDIIVGHLPGETSAVEALGFRSCLLPEPAHNRMYERLSSDLTRLAVCMDQLRQRVDDLVDRIQAIQAGDTATQLTDHLDGLRRRVDELAARVRGLREAGDVRGAAVARDQLAVVKEERAAVAVQIRAIGFAERTELAVVKEERAAVAAQIRAIHAARRTTTPLTGGAHFGDLARLEPQWHEAAQAMAAVPADVLWAADLDGLPPVIWASEAAIERPPVIFDAHELFCDLEYLPELYRAGWRMIADRFIPLATAVVTVSEEIARILEEEHGAKQTFVIPNYAMPGSAPKRGVRSVLGLDRATPLAVHIGHVGPGRNPKYAINVLVDLPQLHMAFVGHADAGIADEVQSLAEARGVGTRLHFVPPVPLEELIGFIAEADLSLMMYDGSQGRNIRLGMPNKLFDSLAAGLPVIGPEGTSAGDFIVRGRLGRVFRLDTPGQLAAAVLELLNDQETKDRVSRQAIQFQWTQVEPALCALVEGLTGAAAAARDC